MVLKTEIDFKIHNYLKRLLIYYFLKMHKDMVSVLQNLKNG